MPINYDEMQAAEDHVFIVRGQTFVVRDVHPKIFGRIREVEAKLEEATTHEDILAICEERLLLLLDDQNGALERWEKLRADEEKPVTYGEIMDMSRRAVEMVTGVPTMPPAPSAAGRGKTAASSLAGSPSPVETSTP